MHLIMKCWLRPHWKLVQYMLYEQMWPCLILSVLCTREARKPSLQDTETNTLDLHNLQNGLNK